MNIKSIASSSKGCGYIVESEGKQILIECGVSLKRIRQALDFDMSRIYACLISHEHGDHSGYSKQIERQTNIPIFCTQGTAGKNDLAGYSELKDKQLIQIEGFRITPLALSHDCECYGFLIRVEGKILFYVSDTVEIPYLIPELTHLMVEANHSLELLEHSESFQVERAANTHLDIDTVAEFVAECKEIEEIHLLHMSDDHADSDKFKTTIQDISGVPVYVAG